MAAAGVLFDIAEKVLVMLASPALEEMKMLWGVKDEIRKLGNIISAIKAVLLDAEEKQATSHQVRDWLEKLQEAVYDADDLLDEFHTQAKRRRLVPGNQLTRQAGDSKWT
ncbi:hypothetical protein TorRG33x02_045560 [Trema orientale]|uniref:Disease resistance N-terminal domain-containing protein n=1 Tax=Trema orientale TaxID=63057 RepID=A0A2P5FPR2_TREOI|nr:hypothetical protein TorRG33x02_045560 [Trema orientale]